MTRKIIAIMLILFAGGSWAYLDYLNKQEKAAAEEMRKDMEKAHVRAAAMARLETEIYHDLANCRSAAAKANNDYVTRHEKPVPNQPGQFIAPREVMDEAVKKLESAHVECQQTYEARMGNMEKLVQPAR